MAKSSGLLNLQDARNIVLGYGKVEFGNPLVNLGQVKGDVEFTYTVTPYDVKAGQPIQLLRRFIIGEESSITAPFLELSGNLVALITRNTFPSVDTGASPAGVLFHNSFGGSISLRKAPARFTHPLPEITLAGVGGYIIIYGYSVLPPVELRVPFAEQRESIINAKFDFSADQTRAVGDQLGYVDIFQVVDNA